MSDNQFFIVGAQRSGSTYLYNLLDGHPEVCMAKPVRPEPKYFLNKKFEDVNIGSYYAELYFPDSGVRLFGEKSTSYYEVEEVPCLLHKVFPDSKIVFMLRNPVWRALSNYFFSVDNGLESRSLTEVFLDNKPLKTQSNVSVDPFNYLGRGEYVVFLKRYLEYFNQEQVKILFFEDFIGSIDEFNDLCAFLGVRKINQPSNIQAVANQSSAKEEVPQSVLDFLHIYYAKFNKELETLLNVNLDMWR